MNTDPFLEQILDRLDKLTNGDLFEQCAPELLRDEWPSMVPVPGGRDAGMDGAWAEAKKRGFLVCTVSPNVIGNVTKSLKSHRAEGCTLRHVLVATSQNLTPRQCRNIENRVEQLGFRLANQPYTQQALAQRLYHRPDLCGRLLGLSGTASALSKVPKGYRPCRDLPLIGRDADLDWLKETAGDRLIVGQPGAGKGFLLQQLAGDGEALFVIEKNVQRLADAIRAQSPSALIIEDAHLCPAFLDDLEDLRDKAGMKFDIIADCWPASEPDLQSRLRLTGRQIRRLGKLKRPEIVKIIEAVGVGGPPRLILEIVRQSAGRPGLASLLSYFCIAGDVKDVWLGERLYLEINRKLKELVGEDSAQLLAAFALGGASGMPLPAVARALGVPNGTIALKVAKLSAGGVVKQIDRLTISVHPEPLRSILVREGFYSKDQPCSVDPEVLLASACDRQEAVRALLGAYARKAAISLNTLYEHVEFIDSPSLWQDFASLNKEATLLTLQRRPELVRSIAWPFLEHIPEIAVTILLEHAVCDDRTLHTATDHPIRQLSEWVTSAEPGRGLALRRRRAVLIAASQWIRSGKDISIGVKALALALSPRFEDHQPQPSTPRAIVLRSGVLTARELCELAQCWPEVRQLLDCTNVTDWKPIIDCFSQWLLPARLGKIAEPTALQCRQTAQQMITDVIALASKRPGVLRVIREKAQWGELTLDVLVDKEFEVLFPLTDYKEDWRTRRTKQEADALALAQAWSNVPPAEVVSRLVWLISEASSAGLGGFGLAGFVCTKIAEMTSTPCAWTHCLIQGDGPAELVGPFLRESAVRDEADWQRTAADCLGNNRLKPAAISVILSSPNSSPELLGRLLNSLQGMEPFIEHHVSAGLSEDRTILLLQHPDAAIASAAAKGLQFRDDRIADSLRTAWRKAVIEHVSNDSDLVRAFEADSEVAFHWLRDVATRSRQGYHCFSEVVIPTAASYLTGEQKEAILMEVNEVFEADDIVMCLVGGNVDLYRRLLSWPHQSRFHLAPLHRSPEGEWVDLACIALEAGYSPEVIAQETVCLDFGWVGSLADRYREEADKFAALLSHSNSHIQHIGRLGQQIMLQHYEREAAQEAADEACDLD